MLHVCFEETGASWWLLSWVRWIVCFRQTLSTVTGVWLDSRYCFGLLSDRFIQRWITVALTPDLCPLLGVLEIEDSVIERSDEFFNDLRSFRSHNKEECVHSLRMEWVFGSGYGTGFAVIIGNWSLFCLADFLKSPQAWWSEWRMTHRLMWTLISVGGPVCPNSVMGSASVALTILFSAHHLIISGTFSYRINSRLFPTPLHSERCPVCKKHKSSHPHTLTNPALIR